MDGISLTLTGYNQSKLFERSLIYLARQTLPPEKWELIVVDDCSSEDWPALLASYQDKIDIKYIRLIHAKGWRCCEVGYNRAFSEAKFDILASTNPHLILHPQALECLYLVHQSERAKKAQGKLWASLRGYTITREDMPYFDTVNWQEELGNLKQLPHFDNPWTKLWTDPNRFYGSFLCCSFRKDKWFEDVAVKEHRGITNEGPPGFPETLSYGNCDTFFLGARRHAGWIDINFDIEKVYFMHQDHYTHRELATRFRVRSFLNEDGQSEITAPWWGQTWKAINPDGLWPSPPVPWESYSQGSKKLPELRPEFAYYYDPKWAKENAPWLVEELE